jgi:hypothetical protein
MQEFWMIFEQGIGQEFDADLPTIVRGIFTTTESEIFLKAQKMINRDGFDEWVKVNNLYPCKKCDVKRMEDHMLHRLEQVRYLHIVKIQTEIDICVNLDNNLTFVIPHLCQDEDALTHAEYKLYEKIVRKLTY